MKLRRNKTIIFSLFVALVNLFALGCFFTGQNLHSNHSGAMSSRDCCASASYNISDHAGYNLQSNLANGDYLALNLTLFLSLLILFISRDSVFLSYYLVKDRYGGFKLFDKFTLLFKTGILQPKLY